MGRALPGLLLIRVRFGNYKQNLGFFGTNSGLWAMWRPCPKFGTFLLALYLISASKFQIWEYPKCWVIPETSGLPDISGNTRYSGFTATRLFSKLNWVGSGSK